MLQICKIRQKQCKCVDSVFDVTKRCTSKDFAQTKKTFNYYYKHFL